MHVTLKCRTIAGIWERAFFACALVVLNTLVPVAAAKAPRNTSADKRPASHAATPAAQNTGLKPFDLQVLLDRNGFSPGEIDGRGGSNTRTALAAFQKARGLPSSPAVDTATRQALGVTSPANTLTSYTITAQEAAGPFTRSIPRDMMQKSKLSALNFASLLEALGEKFHVKPSLLRELNPGGRFNAGEQIKVPNISASGNQPGTKGPSPAAGGPVTVVVSKEHSALIVQTQDGKVLFFAPVTTGSEHDPLPAGNWKVTGIQRSPTFHYNPQLFWDANPKHSKARIPPGPNNPVGVVWIDINRPHYGLHGTPEPGRIGHTESHGCVRLTNWDAMTVASHVKPGTPVIFK